MKKSELKKKVKELIKQSLNAKRINKIIDELDKSGNIDIENSECYGLPKDIVCALSMQLYHDFQPVYSKDKTKIAKIYNSIPPFI